MGAFWGTFLRLNYSFCIWTWSISNVDKWATVSLLHQKYELLAQTYKRTLILLKLRCPSCQRAQSCVVRRPGVWGLGAQTRRPSQAPVGPVLAYAPWGWRDLLAGFKQAASKSRIRPFLLFILTSVVLPCNALPVKALPSGNLWVVDSVYRRRMCVRICLWWHNRKDNSFRSCSPLDSVGP